MADPRLSLILVSPHGWPDLVLALPGLRAQTIAKDIELILAAKPGAFPSDIADRIEGLHSVKLVETTNLLPRGAAVTDAVPHASAPFIGTHENHAFAEPETYESILEAMTEKTGCIAPVYYCLNADNDWAAATSVVTHGHCSAPVDGESRPLLVLHSAIYPAEVLRPRAHLFRNEAELHQALYDEGLEVRILPGTVNWHVEAGAASMAFSIADLTGFMYGWKRSREWGLGQKLLRAVALPAIAAITMKRFVGTLLRMEDLEKKRFKLVPHLILLSMTFATGEVRGYFMRKNPWPEWAEWHEYDLLERLVGPPPKRRELIHAMNHFHDPVPDPIRFSTAAK